MTAATIGALLTVLLSSGVLAAFIADRSTKRGLRANQGKTDAETRSIASATARAEVQQALDNLRHDLAEARARAREAEDRAKGYRVDLDDLERRFKLLESDLQDAHEQADNLGEQLEAMREGNRLLRAELDATRLTLEAQRAAAAGGRARDRRTAAAKRTADRQLSVAREQAGRVAVLVEHAQRVEAWWDEHSPHHPDADAPPTVVLN